MEWNAAVWSAVAASFAAISSFLMMRIQRLNYLESAKPEIVLDLWGRIQRGEGESAHEVVTFGKIRNIGKGPALHLTVNCSIINDNYPVAMLTADRYGIIGPGEEQRVQGEITLWWKNVKDKDGYKYLPLKIVIWSWDTRNIRHETEYSLFVTETSHMGVGGLQKLAPGVSLSMRTTRSEPVWWLKAKARWQRFTQRKK